MKADKFGATAKGRRAPGQMNKTEAAYYEYLKARGDVAVIEFEKTSFRLAERCTYTPDFMVVLKDGEAQFHEVKGSKAIFQDDAKVKIKVAAGMVPFRFFVAIPAKGRKGQWDIEEVKPWKIPF